MATTYSQNYQLKLIGSGLEAGTWGTSTNANLKLLEQMAGSSSEVDITATANGSVWTSGTKTFEFVTQDSAAAGEGGGKGRSNYIKFTGATGGDATVEICGNSTSSSCERVFWAHNLTTTADATITFKNHDASNTSYVLGNGAVALLHVSSAGVENVLQVSQLAQIDNFDVDKTNIIVKDDQDIALQFSTGSARTALGALLTFDTSPAGSGRRVVVGGKTDLLDITSVDGIHFNPATNNYFTVPTGDSAAIIFRDSDGDDYITIDSATNKLILGDAVVDVKVNSGEVDFAAATDFKLISSSTALKIKDVSADFVTFDTAASPNKVTITGDLAVTAALSAAATTLTGTLALQSATAIDLTNQASDITLANNTASAIQVKEGSDTYLECSTASKILYLGDDSVPYVAVRSPVLSTALQTTDFNVKDNEDNALEFKSSGGDQLIRLRTTSGSERVEFSSPVTGNANGSLTVGNGLTVTAGGATVTAGNVTVSSGNVSVTGSVSASTTVSATTTVTAGTGLTVTANDATIANGNLVLGTNNKGIHIDDNSGVSARVMTLGASDQLAFGNGTTVDSIEFQCNTNAFKVQVAAGPLKNIWTDLSTELDSTGGAVDWKLNNNNVAALEIKDGAGASMLTFDTVDATKSIDAKVAIFAELGLRTADSQNVIVNKGGGYYMRNFGDSADYSFAQLSGSTNLLVIGQSDNDKNDGISLRASGDASSVADLLTYNYGSGEQKVWHEGNVANPWGTQSSATYFQSSALTGTDIDGSSEGDAAHGLSGTPRFVWAVLKNKSGGVAEGYWPANVEVAINNSPTNSGGNAGARQGVQVGADATKVYYNVGNGGISVLDGTDNRGNQIDTTEWELYIRAML